VRVECGRRIYIYTLWGDEPVEGKVEVVRDGWMDVGGIDGQVCTREEDGFALSLDRWAGC
jgi:hypothetical protein